MAVDQGVAVGQRLAMDNFGVCTGILLLFNFPFSSIEVLSNSSLKQSSIIYSDSRISSEYTPQHGSQYYRETMIHFRFAQTR